MPSLLQRFLGRTAPKRLAGVDVSSYQGPPGTWSKAAGKISWAAVKVTELEPDGTRYVNPEARADWAWLGRRRKGRIGYLFGHPSVSPTDSARFFAGELRKLGLKNSDGVALDLEVTDGRTAAQVSSWARTAMAELKRELRREPVLYTFLAFAQQGNCAGLGRYPLWIADPSSPPGRPRVPRPWHSWAIDQYDITGPIDRDVADYPSLARMAAALGRHEELTLIRLGGPVTGALAAARWENTITVVAARGKDGFIEATRWAAGEWSPWRKVSPSKAQGAPALSAWGKGDGRLYYTDESGIAWAMVSTDAGKTWT